MEVLGKKMAKLQHLQKFVEEVGSAEMRETLMIAGEPQIPRGMAHSGITSPKVMLSRNIRKLPNTLSIQHGNQDSPCRMRRIQVLRRQQILLLELSDVS